jgi:predicted metal-dependent peptidase
MLIYFTDGYGTLPDRAPKQELLWILEPEGNLKKQVKMGEVCVLS